MSPSDARFPPRGLVLGSAASTNVRLSENEGVSPQHAVIEVCTAFYLRAYLLPPPSTALDPAVDSRKRTFFPVHTALPALLTLLPLLTLINLLTLLALLILLHLAYDPFHFFSIVPPD